MGSARPEDYRNDPVAAAMVTEGANALRDPDHPVMAAISVAEMARRVGVTERTGYAKWDAEDLHVAIIREALSLDNAASHRIDADELVDQARQLIDGDDIAPSQVMATLFNMAWQSLVDDPDLQAAHALWPYCMGEGRVSAEIRTCLTEYYDGWVKRLLSIIDSFVAKHSRKVTVRSDLSRSDMGILAVLFAEGAAYQARLRRTRGAEPFDAELPGVLIQVMTGYALEFHEDDGLHPFDAHLKRLDTPDPE